MFTSRLEVSSRTPSGGAAIRLKAPKGQGAIQFSITRVGSADSVLGNAGWQPSEHWFFVTSKDIFNEDDLILVTLGPEVVGQLSIANYRLTVKRNGQSDFQEGILLGGLVKVPSETHNEPCLTRTNTEQVRGDRGVERSELNGAKIELPELAPVGEQASPKATSIPAQGASPIGEPSRAGDPNAAREPPTVTIQPQTLTPHVVATPTSKIVDKPKTTPPRTVPPVSNPVVPRIEPSINDTPTKSRFSSPRVYFSLAAVALCVCLWVLVSALSPKVPEKKHETPDVTAQKAPEVQTPQPSIPEASMQEANRIVNAISDLNQLYLIGMDWRKKGHAAEAFLVLEKAGKGGHEGAALAVGEMFDPSRRASVPLSFPIANAAQAATWYLAAAKGGANVKSNVDNLKRYLSTINNIDIDPHVKAESIFTLSQINP